MIKLAVIGEGNISHKHLEVVSSLKNFKLVSIYSRTKKSLNVSKKFGIKKVFSSIDKMFDKDNYDAVLVFVGAENMYKTLIKIIKYKTHFFLKTCVSKF